MNKSIKWKIGLVVIVIVFSVLMFYPPKDKINLGLDLKGGIHLRLQVLTEKAIESQTNQAIAQVKSSFKKSGIKFDKIVRKKYNRIEMSGILYEDETKIKDILDDDFGNWTYTISGTYGTLNLKASKEILMRSQSVNQARDTIENRIDEFGVTEPVFQIEGKDRILVQLPGVNDKEKARIMDLIKSTAVLELKEVVSRFLQAETEKDALEIYGEKLSDDMVLLKTNPKTIKEGKGYFVLKAASVITGKELKRAYRSQDSYGAPAVGFTLSSQGASKIGKFSAANIGKRLAIVLDNKVMSAPTVEGTLSYNNQITGRFTVDAVNDLVLILRSGALPADLVTLEQRIIGPSLGADSIRKGIFAIVVGLFLVIIFMLVFYRGAGINSVIALLLNMVILMGILAYFKATLTLPGIAGILLTIGMAVDANVLIFERIKEDLRAGKAPKTAIDSGFKKAFVTIFDANLTTIIAAIFLFQFGTGPIKGFSVTLIIGIVASMFTAVFASRIVFDLVYSGRKKLKKISI